MPAPPPLNDIHQNILKRLYALEMKDREVLREWLELKSDWNRSLAVTQLPNEILFHIFVYFCQQPRGSSEDYAQNSDGLPKLRLAKTELMKLMLVCRRWRDVALATPALWRTINVGKTSGWMNLKLALMRSGDATIDVSFSSDFSEDQASILQPNCHRLRSFCLRSYSPYALRIIHNTLPALETLEIHTNPEGMRAEGSYTDLGISHEHFPNLRTLRLAYTIIPEDPLFYSRLRKLSLTACHFKVTVSLEQFAQLLTTFTCLEHLELSKFLQHLSDSGTAEPAWPLPQSLLSLRLFNHIPVHSARFLSRIVIPTTTSLSIKAHMGGVEGLEEQPNTLLAIVPSMPGLTSSLPGLAVVTRARLHIVRWIQHAIECFSTQLGRDEVRVIELAPTDSTDVIDLRDSMDLSDTLADIVVLLRSAPLTHLEIIGQFTSVGAETWISIFRTFPSLVSLEAGVDETLFDGLQEVSLASFPEEQVACLQLERICISYGQGDPESPELLFKPLVDYLRCRADKGSRLKELCIDASLCTRRDVHVHIDAIKVYLPCLEDLVTKVELRQGHNSANRTDYEAN